jgi:hypothetical protein
VKSSKGGPPQAAFLWVNTAHGNGKSVCRSEVGRATVPAGMGSARWPILLFISRDSPGRKTTTHGLRRTIQAGKRHIMELKLDKFVATKLLVAPKFLIPVFDLQTMDSLKLSLIMCH